MLRLNAINCHQVELSSIENDKFITIECDLVKLCALIIIEDWTQYEIHNPKFVGETYPCATTINYKWIFQEL